MTDNNASRAGTFIPASKNLVESGAHSVIRDLIILGVLNGLLVALSHMIFSVYVMLGPLAFFLQFFHQSMENMLIASVYLLMVVTAPGRRPFTLQALVWGSMGLMMGWWTLIVVAVPGGLLADEIIKRAVPKKRKGWILFGFVFYTVTLTVGTYWAYVFMKQSSMIQRMVAMDPGLNQVLDMFTWTFFASQILATIITGVVGGYFALKMIERHFGLESGLPC
jgi:putative ECF transporter S component (TIGR02185 family)